MKYFLTRGFLYTNLNFIKEQSGGEAVESAPCYLFKKSILFKNFSNNTSTSYVVA